MKTSTFQTSNKNIVRISALNFFVASLGLPESFLGLPGDLVSNIINKEAYSKLQGSYKKLKGRNTYNIFLLFWLKRWQQKDISKLTDLYLKW